AARAPDPRSRTAEGAAGAAAAASAPAGGEAPRGRARAAPRTRSSARCRRRPRRRCRRAARPSRRALGFAPRRDRPRIPCTTPLRTGRISASKPSQSLCRCPGASVTQNTTIEKLLRGGHPLAEAFQLELDCDRAVGFPGAPAHVTPADDPKPPAARVVLPADELLERLLLEERIAVARD